MVGSNLAIGTFHLSSMSSITQLLHQLLDPRKFVGLAMIVDGILFQLLVTYHYILQASSITAAIR